MTRARNSANLASQGNLFVDITNDRTGIGSVVPAQNLHVAGTAGFHADTTFVGDLYNTTWDRSDNSLKFGDNSKLKFGNTEDALHIYHDSANVNFIISPTNRQLQYKSDGGLLIRGGGNQLIANFLESAVTLYKGQQVKLTTVDHGINVTGTTDTDGLVVSGVATVTTMNVTGVLTYEDVTSVDSVGIITARQGVHIDDSIVHIGDTNTKIRFPANDQISFETGGSEQMKVAGTNITLGTNSTTGHILQIKNRNVDSRNTNALGLDIQAAWMRIGDALSGGQTYSNGLGIKFHDGGVIHWSIGKIGSDFYISNTSNSGTQLFPSSRTDALVLTNAGNATFSGNLTVSGNLSVTGSTTQNNSVSTTQKTITLASGAANNAAADGAGIVVDAGSDTDKTLKWLDNTDRWTFTGGDVAANAFHGDGSNLTGISGVSIANQSNNRLITATGTTDALNAEGNLTFDGTRLLVGTTQNLSKLTVDTDFGVIRSSSDPTINLLLGTTSSITQLYRILIDDSDSDKLQIRDNDTPRITMTSSGNLGINQTSPQRYLHITGNDGATGATLGNSDTQLVIDNTGGNGAIVEFLSSNNGAGRIMFTDTDAVNRGRVEYSHNGDYMRFDTNSAERIRIDSSGRVLISGQDVFSSTSLTHRLQVKSQNDAHAIAIIGRNGDDIGELTFFEADKSTRLGEIQYRQDHVNFRHRVGDIRFATGGTTERLRIDSDGQLGLSVTPDTWSTGHGLTIGTSQATLWGAGDQINLSGNAYFNSGWKAAATKAGASQIEQSLGNIDFKVSGSVTADSAITWIDAVRIASDGNMGLGLTPAYSGLFGGAQRTFHIGGTAAPCLRITSSTSGQADLVVHAGNSGRRADIANLATNGSIAIWTKPSSGSIAERIRIDSSGRLLIGATGANMNAMVQIQGRYVDASSSTVDLNTTGSEGPNLKLHTSSNSANHCAAIVFDHGSLKSMIAGGRSNTGNWGTDLRFYTHKDTTSDVHETYERMRITSSGQLNLAGNMKFTAANPELEFNSGGPRFRVPSSNTLTVHTGGGLGSTSNERLRLSSAGTFGVGTVNPDSNYKIDCNGRLRIGDGNAGHRIVFSRSGLGDELVLGVDGYGNSNNNEATIQSSINSARPLVFATNNAERLRITSGGDTELRVLVSSVTNSYSPSLKFRIRQTNGQAAVTSQIAGQGKSAWGGELVFYTKSANSTPNDTVTERARIAQNGRFGIGTGTSIDSKLHVKSSGQASSDGFRLETGSSGTGAKLLLMTTDNTDQSKYIRHSAYWTEIGCHNNEGVRFRESDGDIRFYMNGSSGNYNFTGSNVSDRNLKENIETITTNSIDLIKQVIPRTFNWKFDRKNIPHGGFIAQEMQPLFPKLINGVEYDESRTDDGASDEPDAGKCNPTGMGFDYNGYTAYLTKAMQELIAKVETLEAEVAALKGS